MNRAEAIAVVEAAIAAKIERTSVPPNTDAAAVEADLRAHICEPFALHAEVMSPGFPFATVGSRLSGLCVAHRHGYWLVYQPEEDRFMCFWGECAANLGAHGVYGNPLYCWSA